MRAKSLIILVIILSSFEALPQEPSANIFRTLALDTENCIEGYAEDSGLNNFSYHSFRSELTASMITRCTDGKMSIQWHTAPVPDIISGEGMGFIWVAAIDLTNESHRFDILINNRYRFKVFSGNKENWTVKGEEGGSLSFKTVELDQHGDAHGFMILEAPPDWLVPGEAMEIKMTGSADDHNTWIIVYKAPDALEHLTKSALYNIDCLLTLQEINNKVRAYVKFPSYLAGTGLTFQSGLKKGRLVLKLHPDNYSFAVIDLKSQAWHQPLSISDKIGDIIYIKEAGKTGKDFKLYMESVVSSLATKIEDGSIFIKGGRKYNSGTSSELISLSESGLSKGKILLMNSSHQDIAWMDTPEKCVLERDTMLLMPLIKIARGNPSYRFDVEDALMLKEFTVRHPDLTDIVGDMLNKGRLSCGSTYIQPYEEMYSGESLARQFYFGARWLKETFNYTADTYWNVDVPGRTMQMPQLMSKSGTNNLMISRFEKGLFEWYSPDGSSVTVYSSGHYASSYGALQRDFIESSRYLAESSMFWDKYYSDSAVPIIPLLSDWDMSPAKDYSELIDNWSAVSEVITGEGMPLKISLPPIVQVTSPEFFRQVRDAAGSIPEISGERPAVWLYIHGPSHYEAIKKSREGDIKLPVAEKFSSVLSMIENDPNLYPSQRLAGAWENKIFPDHGWGGKGGDITDNLFANKYRVALEEANGIIELTLDRISSNINYNEKLGKPIVVYNSSSWVRDDVVEVDLSFSTSNYNNVSVFDSKGQRIKSQLESVKRNVHGSILTATLVFIAEKVPSVGYKTYYYKPLEGKVADAEQKIRISSLENRFYRVQLDHRGIYSLFDRELKVELIKPDGMRAGEVFTMRSTGNGAGEFADIQKPDMEGYDYTGADKAEAYWEIENKGEVFTEIKIRQRINHADVERYIRIYNDIKKIDFNIDLLNWEGILFREFRMAVPLNMKEGKVSYEVPFGVVEVGRDELEGAAGERYITDCSDIHPRGILNWIGANNEQYGVTLSSEVAVADYIDPRDKPQEDIVLQPILLASRKSCHWEGNEYLQTGNHHYHFSLSSHLPGWKHGYKFGLSSNEKLLVSRPAGKYKEATLPEEFGFFSIDSPGVIITTIKMAEDGLGYIVRLAEMEGENTEVTFNSFKKIEHMNSTSLIEYDFKTGKSSIPHRGIKIGHNAINTYRFKISQTSNN